MWVKPEAGDVRVGQEVKVPRRVGTFTAKVRTGTVVNMSSCQRYCNVRLEYGMVGMTLPYSVNDVEVWRLRRKRKESSKVALTG